jgi:SAM-dependent methyltransferase
MGVRLSRKKPRNWLASVLYRLNRLLPRDTMLDVAAVADRLARDNASKAGVNIWGDDGFLHKHIRPEDRVLEIGCSSGRVLASVQAAELVGVDTDARAIARGRDEHPSVTFVLGEARDYLGKAGLFDVLILSHVLEHIDRPEEFLASLKGHFERIYIEVPDFDCNTLNQVRLKRGRDLIYTDEDHVAEFDRDEVEHILGSVGLDVLDREFRFGVMRYWVAPGSAQALMPTATQ